MRVAWIKLGGSLVRIKCIGNLVVTRFVLGQSQSWNQHHWSVTGEDKLTKVPRSYQTSEMYGFNLIARE